MPVPSFTYAFLPGEKIAQGFVRMLGEISVRGRDLTQCSHEPIGELIHEGRLLIKRVRALLWFARPALSLAEYMRAREQLRRASGLLASQRDFAVTQTTLVELARKASKRRDRAAAAQISRSLAGTSGTGRAERKALRETLQQAMGILCQSAAGIRGSAASRRAWPSPSARLEKAFRAMRQAGKKARRTEENVDFHMWRKKAKRLLYQLELMNPAASNGVLEAASSDLAGARSPGQQVARATQDAARRKRRGIYPEKLMQEGTERRMARAMKRVEKLQDKLGAYHDGVVVEEHLRRMVPLSVSARRVLDLIEKRKKCLRKSAEKIARRISAK